MLSLSASGVQACVTTTLRWKMSDEADPAIQEPLRQVMLWLEIWDEVRLNEHEKQETAKAWRQVLQRSLEPSMRLRKASGPIAGTINALASAGWKTPSPGYWRDASGNREAVLDGRPELKQFVKQAV